MELEQKGLVWGPPYIESRFRSPRRSADFDRGREKWDNWSRTGGEPRE